MRNGDNGKGSESARKIETVSLRAIEKYRDDEIERGGNREMER